MQKWIAAIALFLFAPAVVAQDRDIWRFWTFSDGLQETFSYSLGLGPGGSVTIRHGAVPFMSVLDGYTVAHIADPHLEVRADEFTRGRATLAANGFRLGGHRWKPDGIPGRPVDTAIPDAAWPAPDRGGARGEPGDRVVLHRAARIRSGPRDVEGVQEPGQYPRGGLYGDDGARPGFLDLRRARSGPLAVGGKRSSRVERDIRRGRRAER